MAYLDDVTSQIAVQINQQQINSQNLMGLKPGAAFASYYPSYEALTPQHQVPNAYSLAQMGYRTNEVVYSIISKRAKAIANAPLWVWKDAAGAPIEQKDHRFRNLLKQANYGIGEKMFWMITEIYRSIAGFCAWEVESNNYGEPIRLWPMRPDWCSFLRGPDLEGNQRPLRAIRYQPYGMPYQDVPIERVIITGYFDPLYPLVKFYSPTMNALKQIGVDNSMTDFLTDFVRHGAKFAGLLSVASTLTDNQAADIKRRFREAHGGTQNWSDPMVQGLGTKYESMQMNFRDMAFPELDGRTESRICESFEISPIIVGAKIGLERSTYSNYEQANKAWYNEWVTPEWELIADAMGEQVLPRYHEDVTQYYFEFNLSKVKALQEDATARVTRAKDAFTSRFWTLDESREETGKNPEGGDLGKSYYEIVRLSPQQNVNAEGVPEQSDSSGQAIPQAKPAAKPILSPHQQKTQAELDAAAAEEKMFRAFAKRRIGERNAADIPEFEFKHIADKRRKELIDQYTSIALADSINRAAGG